MSALLPLLLLPIAAVLISRYLVVEPGARIRRVRRELLWMGPIEWHWPLFGSFRRRPYDQAIDD